MSVGAVYSVVRNAVHDAVSDAVHNVVSDAVYDAVHNAVYNDVRYDVHNAVWYTVGDVGDVVRYYVRVAVDNSTYTRADILRVEKIIQGQLS